MFVHTGGDCGGIRLAMLDDDSEEVSNILDSGGVVERKRMAVLKTGTE